MVFRDVIFWFSRGEPWSSTYLLFEGWLRNSLPPDFTLRKAVCLQRIKSTAGPMPCCKYLTSHCTECRYFSGLQISTKNSSFPGLISSVGFFAFSMSSRTPFSAFDRTHLGVWLTLRFYIVAPIDQCFEHYDTSAIEVLKFYDNVLLPKSGAVLK